MNPLRIFRKLCGPQYKQARPVTDRHLGIPADDTSSKDGIDFPKYAKSDIAEEFLTERIKSNEFLKTIINPNRLKLIIDAMYLKEYQADDQIIREGDFGSHLFVSADGSFEVTKNGVVLKRFTIGEVFGELAILYNCKRNATVKAKSNAKVWVLDRSAYQNIIHITNFQEIQENLEFLSCIPALQDLNSVQLVQLNDLFENDFFPTGTEIIRQGDIGDKFYIIRVGKVTIRQRVQIENSNNEMEISLGILGRGSYFGELALTSEVCRQASIIAQAPGVECLILDRNSFQTYLANIESISSKSYHKSISKTVEENQDYSHVRLKDLISVGALGIGGFGYVELVQYKKDRSKSFALKRIIKRNAETQKQKDHIFNEKNSLSRCHSLFICKFYKTYKDNKYLYILMEACLGGDIWTLLSKQEYLEEVPAKFITACVVEALEYLHTRDLIFRDLKCENVVLDYRGYAKLIDFGSSKRLMEDKTYTFCATEYLPPEVILGKGHDRAVDLWSLGNFINELLSGKKLFAGENAMETYKNVFKGVSKFKFGNRVPRSAQNLVKKLCELNPAQRLGYQTGIQIIRNHRWFDGFQWSELQQGKLTAPIIKPVKGPTDLSNFCVKIEAMPIPQDDYTDWDKDF